MDTVRIFAVQLLATDLDPNLQQITIDRGTQVHIYIGQPVFRRSWHFWSSS